MSGGKEIQNGKKKTLKDGKVPRYIRQMYIAVSFIDPSAYMPLCCTREWCHGLMHTGRICERGAGV